MPLIEIERLSFEYRSGIRAVNEISTRFEPAELVSIVGPNGSGKSTLLKLMARVLIPPERTIRFRERDIMEWDARAYAREIGYLPQAPEPGFPMRALDVVLSGRVPFLGRFEWETKADLNAAGEALEQCDATHLADRFLDEMSGGERKRVFLARALVGNPGVVLLDEPLAALDLKHVQEFVLLLRNIARTASKTVIFISHDINWSAACSDRMLVLNEGRLVLDSVPAEVMKQEVMERYFGFAAEPVRASGRDWIVPRLPRD